MDMGRTGEDTIRGGTGRDAIFGPEGRSRILGDSGSDTMISAQDNDAEDFVDCGAGYGPRTTRPARHGGQLLRVSEVPGLIRGLSLSALLARLAYCSTSPALRGGFIGVVDCAPQPYTLGG